MKRTIWLALLIAAAGCGKKDEEAKPKPDPAPAAKVDGAPAAKPAPAAPAAITPRAGESFGTDLGVDGTNPAPWKTAAGATAQIGVLFPEGPDGETARIVVAGADAAGKVTETEVATVDVNMAYGHGVEIEVGADGKALVRVDESGGSGDPGYLAAWRLAWDDAAGKPVIEEKGQWDGTEEPPAWAARKPEQ